MPTLLLEHLPSGAQAIVRNVALFAAQDDHPIWRWLWIEAAPFDAFDRRWPEGTGHSPSPMSHPLKMAGVTIPFPNRESTDGCGPRVYLNAGRWQASMDQEVDLRKVQDLHGNEYAQHLSVGSWLPPSLSTTIGGELAITATHEIRHFSVEFLRVVLGEQFKEVVAIIDEISMNYAVTRYGQEAMQVGTPAHANLARALGLMPEQLHKPARALALSVWAQESDHEALAEAGVLIDSSLWERTRAQKDPHAPQLVNALDQALAVPIEPAVQVLTNWLLSGHHDRAKRSTIEAMIGRPADSLDRVDAERYARFGPQCTCEFLEQWISNPSQTFTTAWGNYFRSRAPHISDIVRDVDGTTARDLRYAINEKLENRGVDPDIWHDLTTLEYSLVPQRETPNRPERVAAAGRTAWQVGFRRAEVEHTKLLKECTALGVTTTNNNPADHVHLEPAESPSVPGSPWTTKGPTAETDQHHQPEVGNTVRQGIRRVRLRPTAKTSTLEQPADMSDKTASRRTAGRHRRRNHYDEDVPKKIPTSPVEPPTGRSRSLERELDGLPPGFTLR